MNANCYYCTHGKVIIKDGIKKAVCSSNDLDKLTKNPLMCTFSCVNYVPNEEQKQYDEYIRTHSVDYDPEAEAKKARKLKRKQKNETMA